jgi:hypothetical protein
MRTHQHHAPHTSGPIPIGDVLPKLRLRVRTIPTLVWRDGAWHLEWIVVSYPEILQVDGSSPAARSTKRRLA